MSGQFEMTFLVLGYLTDVTSTSECASRSSRQICLHSAIGLIPIFLPVRIPEETYSKWRRGSDDALIRSR